MLVMQWFEHGSGRFVATLLRSPLTEFERRLRLSVGFGGFNS